MKSAPIDKRDVLLELDGSGVSPSTVDAPSFLRLAAAFFRLLKANADTSERPLSLNGVSIIDKCAAVAARADDPEIAQFFAAAALRQIGGEEPPHGLQQLAEEARASVRGIGIGQRAKVIIGPWAKDVPTPPPEPESPLDALLSIRAVPIRAGGKRPAVRFASPFEDDFTLAVTEEQARELGGMLYREVEIEALVSRDSQGRVERGELRSYSLVTDGDPRPAWKEWFKNVGGSDWDQIEDLDPEFKH